MDYLTNPISDPNPNCNLFRIKFSYFQNLTNSVYQLFSCSTYR